MAIARKPKTNTDAINPALVDAFIQGADHSPKAAPPAVGPGKKEAVLLRFEADLLARLDDQAERLGMSRSAFIRMAVVKLIEKEEVR